MAAGVITLSMLVIMQLLQLLQRVAALSVIRRDSTHDQLLEPGLWVPLRRRPEPFERRLNRQGESRPLRRDLSADPSRSPNESAR